MADQPDVVRHFISSYYPIKNGDGRVLGVNCVVEITQRRKIEEELERLLQQEKSARAEAEAANRMKDEFLATISRIAYAAHFDSGRDAYQRLAL